MTDWWRGEAPNGQQGIFPSNYVRKLEVPTEKAMYGPPAQYGYQQYPGQYQQQQPNYGQPVPYQQPEQVPVQEEEKKTSKLGQFGKNYGKTFVNATAWYFCNFVKLTNIKGWRDGFRSGCHQFNHLNRIYTYLELSSTIY